MRRRIVPAVLLLAPFASACEVMVQPGRPPVAVAAETAIVVWDRDTQTEHFIRTAAFTGTGGPMAFLVPTPTPPRLKAMNAYNVETAQRTLDANIAPRVVTKPRTVYRLTDDWRFSFGKDDTETTAMPAHAGAASATASDGKGDVEVVSEARVGGYDTAVLRADDPKALLAWLKGRGFESDARLEGWLRPYTQKGWAITAFRFRPKDKTYTSAPVCLSFHTDRPFYPYREPEATNAPPSRSLRVFLIAPERRAGRLESGDWPTKPEYAAPIPEDDIWPLAYTLGVPGPSVRGQWLTSFLDRRPVRPDSELYFDSSPDQKPVEPPPVIRWRDEPVEIPKGLAAMGVAGPLVAVGLAFGAVRRRTSRV